MKKKILLLGYMRNNVGDDLFIAMLLNRYKQVEFVVRETNPSYSEAFKCYDNFIAVPAEGKLIDFDMTGYDACVYIGGSVLFENKNALVSQKVLNEFIFRCKEKNIPFFYISSNFGPYKTKEFYDECIKTFNLIEGITFRDKYSYNEFKKIDSVNYAPDVVFGLDIKKKKKIKDSIGISIIDLELASRGEELNKKAQTYYNMLRNNIISFIDNGKSIFLFSFCEYEGDKRAIKKLLNLLPEKYLKKVKVVEYSGKRGSLYTFVQKYSMMEEMICTRFHSLVLSLVFKQEIIIFSYSKKLEQILSDIPQKFKYFEMTDKLDKLVIKDKWFKSISKNNLKSLTKSAVNQFSSLERKLKLKVLSNKLKIKNIPIKIRIKRKWKYIKKRVKNIIKI